ncbi:MAG: Lrp/AsnC family transcriptional regulator [Candidatus Woesearchaeota archaeon]|nr:Lrp/AsnC family transcriptional regulator [Candidatus Woesearchaeota archaeon]
MFNLMNTEARKLTKNEREVICCLLDNARIPDLHMAEKLKISTQAIGKIRKRLEDDKIIKGYSASIDLDRVGISSHAIALIKVKPELWQKGSESVKKKIDEMSNLTCLCRISRSDVCAVGMFVFKNNSELEDYFHEMQQDGSFEVVDLFQFSEKSIIKDDYTAYIKEHLRRSCRSDLCKLNHSIKLNS